MNTDWSAEQAAAATLAAAFGPGCDVMAYRDTAHGRAWVAPMSTATDPDKLRDHLRHMHDDRELPTALAALARLHANHHHDERGVPHEHR